MSFSSEIKCIYFVIHFMFWVLHAVRKNVLSEQKDIEEELEEAHGSKARP
jgi:hypothetical protein